MNTNSQQGIQRSCPAKAGHAVYAGRYAPPKKKKPRFNEKKIKNGNPIRIQIAVG